VSTHTNSFLVSISYGSIRIFIPINLTIHFSAAGAQVNENTTDVSSHSYDSRKKEFVTYDTPNIVKKKVQYVISKGLAGTMFWELSADRVGSGSLVGTAASNLGTLDQTQNHIQCVKGSLAFDWAIAYT